jgi:pilus assembly protein CpaC
MKRAWYSATALTPWVALAAALAPVLGVSLVLPAMGHAELVTAAAAASIKMPDISGAVPTGTAPPPAGPPSPPVLRGARRRIPLAEALAPLPPGVLHVDLSTAGADSQALNLPAGKSALVDLPKDARDVLVTNPAVAKAVPRNHRSVLVQGLAAGTTDAVFFDEAGQKILSLDVRVVPDSGSLAETLQRLLPGSHVHIESVSDSLVLSGDVANAADADKAVRLAARFVGKPEQIVNLLTITGREQVMLKVRIVEMQRTIIKQLGFNLNAVTGQLGMPQYSFGNTPTFGVNNGFLGGATGGYSVNTTAQPVSSFPFGSLGSGAAALAQQAGVTTGNISTIVGQYLTGSSALTAAQQTFSQTFLSGLVGSTQTTVTPAVNATTAGVPYTVTAASVGINTNNIAAYEQAYVNGTGSLAGTLTNDQKLWLNTFNTNLPSYYSTPNTLATNSTYVDRSNPANYVQRGTAGSTGLNQAEGMIQAFERVGLVRTLAEPNLTAISGESAKFQAGGEYPVPVGEDNTGRVTVEFKTYGVMLNFTPVVLSGGRISLKVATEVSELSTDGSITLASGSSTSTSSSLTIPGLKLRRADTTVELPSGGAMMIAGLLQQQTKENLDSLPGLTNMPVLGALFRSRDYQSGETELVVIVTPYLVKPTSPDKLQTPVDGLEIAGDIETDLLGKLNKTSRATPAATAGKTLQGPYGYIIE